MHVARGACAVRACVRCSHAAGGFVFVSWLLNLKRKREREPAPGPNAQSAMRNPRRWLARPVPSSGVRTMHCTKQTVHFETSGCYPIKPTPQKSDAWRKGADEEEEENRDDKQQMQKRGSTLAVRGTSKRKKHYHAQRSANDEARTHDLSLTHSWRFT